MTPILSVQRSGCSEAESPTCTLHAKRAAAERGELRFPLPVGFVYDDERATIIDPDAEVLAAVADVFAAFRAGGSTYQVVAAFEGTPVPAARLRRSVGRVGCQ